MRKFKENHLMVHLMQGVYSYKLLVCEGMKFTLSI